MGSLFTTATGAELSGVTSGDVFLDFVAGTVTLPNGTVSNMNKNLNDLGLSQCNSIGVWTSDADSTIYIGSTVTLSDHKLSHVINNLGFSSVRISLPANSTPDNTNQFSLSPRLTDGLAMIIHKSLTSRTKSQGRPLIQTRFIYKSTSEPIINF